MARANRHSGYNEIQNPRQRYSLIDHESVTSLLDIKNMEELKRSSREWVEELLTRRDEEREPRWTESIAVWSRAFAEWTELGGKAIGGRSVEKMEPMSLESLMLIGGIQHEDQTHKN